MSQTRSVSASVTVGALATLTMDAAFLAADRLGGEAFRSDKVGLEPIGRWTLGLARGRLIQHDIGSDAACRGELAAGLAVHYTTGAALTWLYFELLRREWLKPGVGAAAAYGAATALLPLLVMYPSWGLGAFARKSDEASRLARIMLFGHTSFGAGIGLWTALLRPRIAPS